MTEEQPQRREPLPPHEHENGGSELARLIGVVSESRWLIAGVTAAILVLGVIYSFVKTPVYEADTKLQVLSQQSGGLSGLETLSSLVQGSAIPTDTEIQLLQTRAVLVPVIEKLHLNIQVDGGGLPIVGSLFSRRPKAKVAVFDVPKALEGEAFTLASEGDGRYRLLGPDGSEVLEGTAGKPAVGKVATPAGPGLVNLEIAALGAPAGARIPLTRVPADSVVSSLLDSLRIGEVGQQTGIVQVTMQGTAPALIARELNAIAQTNVQQNIRQNSAQAASQLDFLNAQLPDLERRLEKAQAKLADFLSAHETLALSQDTQYLIDQASTLEQQIGPLEAQIAEAKSALGTANPKLAALQAQLTALEAQRGRLLGRVAKLPKDEQQLVRLQEGVDVAKSLYEALLNQEQQLRVAEAGTVGDVVIVDPAVVPTQPVLPNRPLDILVALVVGLLLGTAAAFVRRALRHGIEDPEVLDERLGLPVFAVLAHSSRQRRLEKAASTEAPGVARLLVAQEEADRTVEGLRSLRMALQLAMLDSGPRVLCVASLSPAEGKTFASANLAYLFAQGGLRILLVDADLRRGHLHRMFGWPRGKGLAEILSGEATVEEAARATALEGLDVVTTGTLPKDAANLWIGSESGRLVERMAALYDLVVMDVPPVLAVGDAFVVARHATLNLLLLKHGLHSLRQVRLAMKRFDRHGIGFAGCVLNDVSSAAQRYAYREYGYQYQYRYKPRSG